MGIHFMIRGMSRYEQVDVHKICQVERNLGFKNREHYFVMARHDDDDHVYRLHRIESIRVIWYAVRIHYFRVYPVPQFRSFFRPFSTFGSSLCMSDMFGEVRTRCFDHRFSLIFDRFSV
jgi:hypothetical protein